MGTTHAPFGATPEGIERYNAMAREHNDLNAKARSGVHARRVAHELA